METKTKRKMVKAIYEAIEKSGITSHIYKDNAWQKVFELKDIAESTSKEYIEDARIIFDIVNDWPTCKRYYVSVEDEYTGERYGGGCIVACFAGSVEDPRDRYDVCATWWAE